MYLGGGQMYEYSALLGSCSHGSLVSMVTIYISATTIWSIWVPFESTRWEDGQQPHGKIKIWMRKMWMTSKMEEIQMTYGWQARLLVFI